MSKGYLFSGQGAQVVGMGKSLAESSERIQALYATADKLLGWSLSRISFHGPEEELTLTRVCQPALYVHGYAVFSELLERGKVDGPALTMGLSLGELTALAAAGAFRFEDGLRVVAERGRLMQEACDASDGAMASIIGGNAESVAAICREADVDMANLNCPGQIVISGERFKILKAVELANADGSFKRVIPLKVAGAYHSRLMEPAREQFAAFLQEVPVATPTVPVISNVTGQAVETPEAIRTALAQQVVSSVRWEDCLRTVRSMGVTDLVECGVGGVLSGLARRTDRDLKVVSIAEWTDLEKA